jgi:hypothetical protein
MRCFHLPLTFLTLLFFGALFTSKAQQSAVHVRPVFDVALKSSLTTVNKATAMSFAANGDLFVLGTTAIPDSLRDFYVTRLSGDGRKLWERTFNSGLQADDIAIAGCTDVFGNYWCTGVVRRTETDADIQLVRFSGDGGAFPGSTVGGVAGLYDAPTCIGTDPTGAVYVGGYVTSLDSGLNAVLCRFDLEGKLLWKQTWSTLQMDIFNELVTDDSCNVYLCGNADVALRRSDLLVAKYDSTGRLVWQHRYDGILGESDAGFHITLEDDSLLAVTGWINHASDRSDIPLLRFTRNGSLLQEKWYNGGQTDGVANNLCVRDSFVVITGDITDYPRGQRYGVFSVWTPSGKDTVVRTTRPGSTILTALPYSGHWLIAGAKNLADGEGMVQPFIALADTGNSWAWQYTDTTVFGLSHVRSLLDRGRRLVYLGDDTGESTGTIYVLGYELVPATEIKKNHVPQGPRKTVPRNR